MTTRTRLIILLILVVLFLVIAPYLVLYSLGYRIDFKNMKVVATGGIYVRVQPYSVNIIIDNKTSESTGRFSNSIFVQNLLPKEYNVLVKKDGYHDYQKNIPVKENEVTKLENVILFNKNISFETLSDNSQFLLLKQKLPERFIIKSNNLYYSDSLENPQLTLLQKNTPVLRNILAFNTSGSNIIWLGSDGFLKSSSLDGGSTEKLSQIALKVDLKKSYRLEILSQNIFLKEDDNLLLFDKVTQLFKNFHSPVKDFKISPDQQKIIYFNNREIFIYYLNQPPPVGNKNNLLLYKSPDMTAQEGKIIDLYWLNNDYIIFNSGDRIIISEVDPRGNINLISLPETINLPDDKVIDITKPEIYFDQQKRLLYILTQNQLIFSGKLLP